MNNKEFAQKVVESIENKDRFTDDYLKGIYFGVLITLNSQDINQEEINRCRAIDIFQNKIFELKNINFITKLHILFIESKNYEFREIERS